MKISELKPYSIGVVAENKKINGKIIEVTLLEVSPMLDGEITSNAQEYKTKGTDSRGSAYDVEMQTAASVSAEWLPMGSSNRMTAPNVRRGEHVVVYRFADADKFFWITYLDDMRLRKLETAIYAWSATTDESKDTDASTSYFFEVSAHKKLVHFHTSKANGEPFEYDIQINTAYGCITIKDDVGQVFSIDSKERRIEMINADGSSFDLDKATMKIVAPESIDISTKSLTMNASTAVINAETTNNGSVTVEGMSTLNAGMSVSGGVGGAVATINGDFQLNGNGTGTGTVSVQRLVSTEAISAPNI